MAELDLAQVDFGVVQRRLLFYAYKLFGLFPSPDHEPVLQGVGESPEDLAVGTITVFLDPDKHLWKPEFGTPTTESVLRLLYTVLKHDFIDLKRQKAHQTTVDLGDPDTTAPGAASLTLDALAVALEGPEAMAVRKQLRGRLLGAVKGESDLEDVLDVLVDPARYDGAETNQEIAALIGVDVAEIVNRKKRIATRVLNRWGMRRRTSKGKGHA